jgi:hypothetical protein
MASVRWTAGRGCFCSKPVLDGLSRIINSPGLQLIQTCSTYFGSQCVVVQGGRTLLDRHWTARWTLAQTASRNTPELPVAPWAAGSFWQVERVVCSSSSLVHPRAESEPWRLMLGTPKSSDQPAISISVSRMYVNVLPMHVDTRAPCPRP